MAREDWTLGIAVFLGATLAMFAFAVQPTEGAPLKPDWRASPQGTESADGYKDTIFGTWVLPFEALSVLLLAALIGSVAMAIRMRGGDEGGE